ncbi:DUF6153 family protein [Streptomyces sp. NPDC002790]|uniref:DUF6153 family protein n=1 Tax=Streptomyces sp. NPDC002790 TaxID=3154431 RepID=UPI003318A106
MARTRSGTGRWQRMLLFAALLLGVVGMHTLGHPTGHAADHTSGHTADAAPMSVSTSMSMSMSMPMPAASAHAAPHHAPAVHEHAPDSPGHGGMDPLNVCLAVLGSLTLLLLTAAVLRPLLTAVAPRPHARGLAFAQRPNPPPPRRLLSRLSVLRI